MKILIQIVCVCTLLTISYGYIKLPLYKKESKEIENFLAQYLLKEEENSLQLNADGKEQALKVIFSNDFVGNISFGTPPQEFQVLLDTTSSLTWVPSSKCKTIVCKKHNLFKYEKSGTYEQASGFKIIENNGLSKMMGEKGKDTLTIGSIIVKEQLFAVVNDIPNDFYDSKIYDGVIGLALSSKDTDEAVLQTMLKQDVLKSNIFSLYLNRTSQEKYTGGELVLGGWNDQYFDPTEINYIPLSKEEKWQFTIDFISSVENTNGVWCQFGCEAVISTVENMIVGPEKEINAIYQYIGALPGFMGMLGVVRCNQIKQLPPITFHINKKEYILESKDYIIQLDSRGQECVAAFMSSLNPDKPWQIGYRFLSKFYTIFNFGEKKIAFAPLKTNI